MPPKKGYKPGSSSYKENTGPNRKQRRAAAAQARKSRKAAKR